MKKILVIITALMLGYVSAFAGSIKVKVTESTEIYNQMEVNVPQTEYIEEEVQVPYPCGRSRDTNSIGLDTLIGAGIGIALGNQIGKGNGRDAAKVIGGLGGAYTANNMRGGAETCYRTETRTRKVTSYVKEYRDTFVGFRNCGYINGEKICVKSKHRQRFIHLNY